MHTFRIVREQNGWAIQFGCAMTTPCRSQATAIQQAEEMAAAIRRHGERVAVIVESFQVNEGAANHSALSPKAVAAARVRARKRVMRAR